MMSERKDSNVGGVRVVPIGAAAPPCMMADGEEDPPPGPPPNDDEGDGEGEGGETSTAVAEEEEQAEAQATKTAPPERKERTRPAPPDRKADRMPPWRVLLHNDDVNDMGYVVETIMDLTPLTFESSYRCMMEAHVRGLALLLVTHQERAELYRDQFHSKSLTVTIEPDESA